MAPSISIITSASQPACNTSPEPSSPSIPIHVEAVCEVPLRLPIDGESVGIVQVPSTHLIRSALEGKTMPPDQMVEVSGP